MTKTDYVQGPWSLRELYSGLEAPEIQAEMNGLEQKVKAFEALRPSLSAKMTDKDFTAALRAYDALLRQLSRLDGFADLLFAQDTQDAKIQAFLAKIRQLVAELDNRTLFFQLWWKPLEEPAAERLMAAAGDFRYWLEALRLQKPYTLSEPEEKIVNLKDVNGSAALVTLYDSITNRYTFHLEVDGKRHELNREELQVYFRDPRPEIRAAAYQELYRVYAQDAPVLSQLYQYRMRDWRSENVRLRGFTSPIAVRNLSNNIPDEVVDTLLEVCRKNAGVFQRYFALKAKTVGIGRLRRYDVYAPVAGTEKTYPFVEAVELVLDSFQRFEPRVATLARKVFAENHIDSEIRHGKRSGAFCATVSPDYTPWLHQTFKGKPQDVATLAHELGHAVHSLMAADHSLLTQHAALPLAETASTFGEMILVDRMLELDPAPDVQRTLLFREMDDNYATILRQAYFAMFEREAAEIIESGGTEEDLSRAYLANLRDQFGEAVDVSDDFRYEWIVVPHFQHTPFYVYAYAFGQLLVLSLYQQYRAEGESFKPRYLKILSAGGSDSPERTLQRAGIDIRSAAFWQGGFNVVESSLVKLQSLESAR
jgi:oligoendopeptidase F